MKLSTKGGGSDFKRVIPKAGSDIARVFRIVDLGTQEVTYQGEKKNIAQIEIAWEFPNQLHVFKEENGEQPLLVTQTYSKSLGDKAKLRLHLNTWGVNLEDDEFELKDLFDTPCFVSVAHNKADNGQTYANVTGTMALPDGLTAPDPIKPRILFSLDEFDSDVYDQLPEFLQDKIAKSPEYQKAVGKVVEDGNADALPI